MSIFVLEEYLKCDNKISSEKEFHEKYTKIRCYHACRTDDINKYLFCGIVSMSLETLLEDISKRFEISSDSPEYDELKYISEKAYNEMNESFVYFNISRNELLNMSKHYLRFGSELMQGIAVKMQQWKYGKYSDKLKEFGLPYLIECDIPLDRIDSWFLDSFINLCINSSLDKNEDISLRVKNSLNKKYINQYELIKRL